MLANEVAEITARSLAEKVNVVLADEVADNS
jgi:hypothetical protein